MIDRDVLPEWKRHIAWQAAWPMLAFVGIIWVVCLSATVGIRGVEVNPLGNLLFCVAIIGSLGSAVKVYVDYRLGKRLARYGVLVLASVHPRRFWQKGNIIYYDYEFQGEYQAKGWYAPLWCALDFQQGGKKLIVVCDPQKPSRSMFLWEVFPPTIQAKVLESLEGSS